MSVSEAELSTLARGHDIISLGIVADEVRKSLHGRRTTFVRVATVRADVGAGIDAPATAGEVRIAGKPAGRTQAVARVADVAAGTRGIPLSAFSLADLEEVSRAEGITLRALLEELKAAGLELIAEAPFEQLQDPRRSIEEVNIAGLSLARLTIGQWPVGDPVDLLKSIAAVQRHVAVVRAFAPLARRVNPAAPTTGYDDIKRVALARVIVDNVPSIQVDWALYGPKLAQVALTVGADDVDAVSPIDDLSQGPRRTALAEVRRNIIAADLDPVERNGRFERVAQPT
jgi:aminodeoxyfutalosine synthase